MRILLVANYALDSQQSMQRYAALLFDGLTKAGHDVRVVRPSARANRFLQGVGLSKWLGYIDKFVLFPPTLKRAADWADVVHICDHSNASYLRYVQDRPHVITCHDLLAVRSALGEFPENRTKWSGRRLQRLILNNLLPARKIVCVSEATRTDVLRLLPRDADTVCRIYNGLNYRYAPMDPGQAGERLQKFGIAPDQNFILHVGGNLWYKNRLGVLRVFELLHKETTTRDLLLVMAGHAWTDEMRQFARAHSLEGCALELIDVADEDLRALYSRAQTLLFPSLEEGFGWPIAEAQACGCPVVTSNRAPMTEVGGDAAAYIDPRDTAAAAVAVASMMASRPAVADASIENAAKFNSARMIEAYIALYAGLLDART